MLHGAKDKQWGHLAHGDIVAALVDGELRRVADEMWLENGDSRIRLDDCQAAAPVIEVIRRLK